ncbi:MAG: hypothetical protein AAFN93_18205 [Bacteroidota bacterium]
MNKTLLTLIILFCSILVHAQRGYDQKKGHALHNKSKIDHWEDADGTRTKNAYYLNSEWALFSMYLKSGCLIEGRLTRFNLLSNQFEIKHGSKIKLLDARKVEYFEFNEKGKIRLFESVNSYGLETGSGERFFEVVVSGNPGLLQATFLAEKSRSADKSTPQKRKNQKLIRNNKYLLFREGQCFEIPSEEKHFYSFFGKKKDKVLRYVHQHRLDITDIDDLKKLILYLKSGV